ncbi:MAG TPA: ABC transporter permease [Candidatus Korarchaeota archaeon]|nr:ABC transporter permease [Candidatus Korarchaeota archaeon]
MKLKRRYVRRPEHVTAIYSIGSSFLLISALLACLGKNPILAIYYMFSSNFSSPFAVSEIFVRASPLIFVSLGTLASFRARFWNLAGDAQFYAGALLATMVGLTPVFKWIHPLACLTAGGVAGLLMGFFIAYLKVRFNADEVVTSLMLNFAAFYFLSLLLQTVMRNPHTNWPESEYLLDSSLLPNLVRGTRFHLGIALAFLLLPLMDLILNRTVFGEEVTAIGINPKAAEINKIDVRGHILKIGALGGFLCGLGGAVEVLGVHHHLTATISANYGIFGVIISTASRLSVYGAGALSVLLSLVINGATSLTRYMQIPSFISDIISALVLITAAIFTALEKYEVIVEWRR